MQFVQIGNKWINAEHITSVRQYDNAPLIDLCFSEGDNDGVICLTNSAEIDAFLRWLTEKAPVYVAI